VILARTTNPRDRIAQGHVAIVTGPGTSIAGNTSPDGKNATGVFEHSYDPAGSRIAGYLGIS
jgi:hypothetical protein